MANEATSEMTTAVDSIISLWHDILGKPRETPVRALFLKGPGGVGRSFALARAGEHIQAEGTHVVAARWAAGADYLDPFLGIVGAKIIHGRLVSEKEHRVIEAGVKLLSVIPLLKYAAKALPVEEWVFGSHLPVDEVLSEELFVGDYLRRLVAAGQDGLVALLDDVQRLDVVGDQAWSFLGTVVGQLAHHHSDVPVLLVLSYCSELPASGLEDQLRVHFAPGTYRVVGVRLSDAEVRSLAVHNLDGHDAARSKPLLAGVVGLAEGRAKPALHAVKAVRSVPGPEEEWLHVLEALQRHDLLRIPVSERTMCELHAAIGGRPDFRAFETEIFHRYWNIAIREAVDLSLEASARMSFRGMTEAVRRQIPPERIRQDVLSYANALVEAHQNHGDVGLLDEAARHYRVAEDREAEAGAKLRAARAYGRQGRISEALDRYRDARLVFPDISPEQRTNYLIEETETAVRGGKAFIALEVFALAERMAFSLSPSKMARALAEIALLHGSLLAHGPNADHFAAIEQFDLSIERGVADLEPRARCEKAYCLDKLGQYDRARREAQIGLDLAHVHANQVDQMFAHLLLGRVLANSPNLDEKKEAEQHLREVADSGFAPLSVRAQAMDALANVYAQIGRHDDALGRFESSAAIKKDIGDRSGLALTYGGLARLYHRKGDLERARDYYNQDLQLTREVTPDDTRVFVQLNNLLADIDRLAGRYDDAHRRLDASAALFLQLAEGMRARNGAFLGMIRGRIFLDEGKIDFAEKTVQDAKIAFGDDAAMQAEMDILVARIETAHGNHERALEITAETRPRLREDYSRFSLEIVVATAAAGKGNTPLRDEALRNAEQIAAMLKNSWMSEQIERMRSSRR